MERKVVRAVAYVLSCALIFVFGMTVVAQGYRLVRRRITVSATAGKAAGNVYPTAPVWVIDPGHGGEDGGASDPSGQVVEKTLNLAVARRIAEIAGLFGHDCRLTREDDRLLYDAYRDLTDYRGKKKTYDLRNRLRITEDAGATLFVGIHMNKFPQPQYHGLQVWYSPNDPKSADYAAFVQSYMKSTLQPDNERMVKKATSSIYLLHRIHCPAILVECGFLSHPDECAALATPEYQTALSAVLFAAAAECENANG